MDRDEPEGGPAPGLPDFRDLRLGVHRVPVEDGPREPHPVDPDLEPVPARLVDQEPGRDRDREEAVHHPPPVERFAREDPPRVVLVEVDLVRVPREEGEPDVVRLRDRAPRLAPEPRADLEILEERPLLVHGNPSGRHGRAY